MFDREERSGGGLYIPEVAKEETIDGLVRAIGRGRFTYKKGIVPVDVSVGDHVVIAKYGGTDITVDDRGYRCVREDDILGVIE
jgi:chaperonin GroES